MPSIQPTVEQVTVALIAYIQTQLGAAADVIGAADRVAIEVVDGDGAPVEEVQDGPKVTVIGPRELSRVPGWRKPTGMRVETARDEDALTYKTRPMPKRRHLTYYVRGQATRQSTESENIPDGESAVRGSLWLKEALTVALDDIRLKDADWDIFVPGWAGYFVEWLQDLTDIPGEGTSMQMFQGIIRIRDVRLFRGAETTGSLATSVELQTVIDGDTGND